MQSSVRIRWGFGLAAMLAAALAWQFLGPMVPGNAVSPLSEAIVAAIGYLSPPLLFEAVLPSVGRVLLGFGVSAVLGVAIGALLGSSPALRPWIRPIIDFLRATPAPVIIPVAIAFLGLDTELVIGVIVFGAIWPVLINTMDAVSRVEPQYLDVSRIAHLGPVATMLTVKLPASAPLIMPGLRLTMQLSLVLMVTAEMLGGSSGLGYELIFSQQTFNIAGTYGGIIVLALIGVLFDIVLVNLEKKYVHS